jgi:predicted amidohydrolase YtcJ
MNSDPSRRSPTARRRPGALLACALVLAAPAYGATTFADRVFVHGAVLTADDRDTVAEALAVRGNTILAVGTDAEVRRHIGPRTEVVDLAGRALTPGLIDTHGHFAEDAARAEQGRIDLTGVRSVDELVARVRERAAAAAPGAWILGDGWDEGKFADGRPPSAADLDAVSGGHPVFLTQTTGHYAVANSRALELAGVTPALRDPVAGTIDRDPAGRPTGVLREAAQELVASRVPRPTPAERQAAIVKILAAAHREGLTAIKEIADRDTWEAYLALARARRLEARVCVLILAGTTLDSARAALATIEGGRRAARSVGDRLRACGAKIFMDGSAVARTAWSYEPWYRDAATPDAGATGYPSVDPAVFREQFHLFHAAGVQVGTHAIGERAIDWVVDTYAAELAEHPRRGLRHTIIHAYLPTPHAIETMGALQRDYDAGYPEVQPGFLWWLAGGYARSFGPARLPRTMPLRSYLEHGVRFGAGADYPVIPLAPRYGLWAAVAREAQDGSHPYGTAEAIDVHAALAAYTRWAAPLLGFETFAGQLKPGARADLAVWHRNPYRVSPGELKDLACDLTLLDGRVVYRAP